MKKRLAFNSFFVILILSLSFAYPVLADNSDKNEKIITLTVNWLEDKPQERPQSIKIELYRYVDGEDIPMDSKTLTAEDRISENTWQVSFNYYYGQVWEYAFRITEVYPETALYQYQMIESGNGTDHYTFDFVYGHGSTTMTIQTIWEETGTKENRPESIKLDLMSLSGEGDSPERIIRLGEEGDQETWTVTVQGLDDSPSNYYIKIDDLPAGYSYTVNRGYDPSTYIVRISYDPGVLSSETLEQSESFTSHVTDVVNSITVAQYQERLQFILIPVVIALIVAIGIGATLLWMRHHKQSRSRGGKNG